MTRRLHQPIAYSQTQGLQLVEALAEQGHLTSSASDAYSAGTALGISQPIMSAALSFSEDLDCTAAGVPSGPALEQSLRVVAGKALASLGTRGPFAIVVERQEHRDPHPAGQEALDLRIRYPWLRMPLCVVEVGTPSVILPALSPLGYNESTRERHCQYRRT